MMSPTPWKIEENSSNALDIVADDGHLVCQVIADLDTDELTEIDRANAKAIIEHVNYYCISMK